MRSVKVVGDPYCQRSLSSAAWFLSVCSTFRLYSVPWVIAMLPLQVLLAVAVTLITWLPASVTFAVSLASTHSTTLPVYGDSSCPCHTSLKLSVGRLVSLAGLSVLQSAYTSGSSRSSAT